MNSPRQPIEGTAARGRPWKCSRQDKAVKEESKGARGQDGAQRVALLQDAGEGAAALGRQGLKDQRRAHAPLAAHRQTKYRAQHQQHRERGRKAAGQLDHRKAQDIPHQHRAAAIAVGQHAKEHRAHRPEGLGQKDRAHHRRGLGVEVHGDGFDAEDQQKKVERIHRPAQEGGHKGVALGPGEALEVVQNGHRRENNREGQGKGIGNRDR